MGGARIASGVELCFRLLFRGVEINIRISVLHRLCVPRSPIPRRVCFHVQMYIPSELGYGESGSPPKIKGGDVLVFTMELISIKGNKKPAVKCDPLTLDQCNEQEQEFVGKIAAWTAEKKATELTRLQKMSTGAMKPELSAWVSRRIIILSRLAATKEEL